MKKNYKVRITETLVMTVDVEAHSRDEAEQIASDNWHNSDYILDADNFVGVEFEATEEEPVRKKNYREERCKEGRGGEGTGASLSLSKH